MIEPSFVRSGEEGVTPKSVDSRKLRGMVKGRSEKFLLES